MNFEVLRVFLARTYRCLPKSRTKSTRTCTSRMVLLASDGFLRPTCTTGLSVSTATGRQHGAKMDGFSGRPESFATLTS